MPEPTQTIAGVPVQVPVAMSPQELFDAFMGQIEPELTTAQVHGLKEKYTNETPEQKQQRTQRYKKSYEEYDRRFAEYTQALNAKVRANHLYAMKSIEEHAHEEDEAQMRFLEDTLSSLPNTSDATPAQ